MDTMMSKDTGSALEKAEEEKVKEKVVEEKEKAVIMTKNIAIMIKRTVATDLRRETLMIFGVVVVADLNHEEKAREIEEVTKVMKVMAEKEKEKEKDFEEAITNLTSRI